MANIYGINSTGISKFFILGVWGLWEALTRFYQFLTQKCNSIRKRFPLHFSNIYMVHMLRIRRLEKFVPDFNNFWRCIALKAVIVHTIIPILSYVFYLYTVKWKNHMEFKIAIHGKSDFAISPIFTEKKFYKPNFVQIFRVVPKL